MINVAERVKKALFEKGWTQKKLCAEIDISETGYKKMADNNTWKLDTIEKMASALGKPVIYFVHETEQKFEQNSTPSNQSAFGEHVIEELKAMFEEEIRVKNQQIAGLQRTVDVLVGKSEGAIDMPGSFQDMTMDQQFDAYKRLGNGLGLQLLTKSIIIPEQNQVAPSSHMMGTWH